jgi:hypothetical protein
MVNHVVPAQGLAATLSLMTKPPISRHATNPREALVEPQLEHPPLTLPPRPERDLIYERRVEADRLCMWMACRRKLCRETRHCSGTLASCIFENPEIVDPILR